MIFDYVESRRNYNGEHILKARCKLCNHKQSVWHIDESSFVTTKKLFIHNYKPYNVTKYAINLCKECFYGYNDFGDEKCEICDDLIYKYHPSILDNEFNRIEIPSKFACSEKMYVRAELMENGTYSCNEKGRKDLEEDIEDYSDEKMEEHILCLECYAKNKIGDDKDILELSQYYVEKIVNDWNTFDKVTMKKVYEYERDYIDNLRSLEGSYYARKRFGRMPIDVRLLDAGVTKKEDYVQIYTSVHKAELKFI